MTPSALHDCKKELEKKIDKKQRAWENIEFFHKRFEDYVNKESPDRYVVFRMGRMLGRMTKIAEDY